MLADKLKEIEEKYDELNRVMSDPAVIGNREKYQKLAAEHADLSLLAEKARAYRSALEDLEAAEDILLNESDEDLRKLARENLLRVFTEVEQLASRLRRSRSPSLATIEELDNRP